MNLLKLSCAVLLGLLGCMSNPEGLQKNLLPRQPAALPDGVLQASEPLGPVVDECLTRGERLLPQAWAEVLAPILDLETLEYIQPDFAFTLHEQGPTKASPSDFKLGVLVGHVVLTSPNDASFDLMERFADRTNKSVYVHDATWRLAWHNAGSQAWATNALVLQVSSHAYAVTPIEKLDYSGMLLLPSKGDIRGLKFPMPGITRTFAERLLLPTFAGHVTFDPKVVGLAQGGKLIACVPAKSKYAQD